MTGLVTEHCALDCHGICPGGSCVCACHEQTAAAPWADTAPAVSAAQTAGMAAALGFLVDRHQPAQFVNGVAQFYACEACTQLAGIPIPWPCPDRAVIADLIDHPTNRLLPGGAS